MSTIIVKGLHRKMKGWKEPEHPNNSLLPSVSFTRQNNSIQLIQNNYKSESKRKKPASSNATISLNFAYIYCSSFWKHGVVCSNLADEFP